MWIDSFLQKPGSDQRASSPHLMVDGPRRTNPTSQVTIRSEPTAEGPGSMAPFNRGGSFPQAILQEN